MTRADPARSVAILIGTARHAPVAGDPLADLPAVAANLTELARVLTGPPVALIDPARCTQLLDLDNPMTAGHAIRDRCADAEDLLLVYYAGHGLVDEHSELHLALSGTSSDLDRLEFTAIPFDRIRREMHRSRARIKVLILDCCYAGRAIDAMATTDPGTALADSTEIDGTFTLTATSGNRTAAAPVGQQFTAFTGELLRLLQHPAPGDDGDLTLTELYRRLEIALVSKNLPRPRQRNSDRVADLVVRPGTAAPAAPPPAPGVTAGPPAPPATHRPVIDTLSRPQNAFHPLHRRLLAPYWRRCWPPAAVLAATYGFFQFWWAVQWGDLRPPGWLPYHGLLLCAAAAPPTIALVMAVVAVRDARRGWRRDSLITGTYVAVCWGLAATAAAWNFWIEPGLLGTGLPTAFVDGLPCLGMLLLVAGGVQAVREGRAPDGAPGSQDRGAPAAALWAVAVVVAVCAGCAIGVPGELWLVTMVLAGVTLGFFACLAVTRVYECLSAHAALSQSLILKLSRDGLVIRRPAHDRFIRWHDLDRIFVAGDTLAIAFKRDYPESAKPQELSFSVALNGYRVADLRHFPHDRQDIVTGIGHFAGATLHGSADPAVEQDPVTWDGRPLTWYTDRWEVH